MAAFPRVTSPCPYKGPLSEILGADDVCGLCHRRVHDLSAMDEHQRLAFLKACSGEICVTYRLPAAVAAAALAAGLLATPAAASPAATPEDEQTTIEGSYEVQDIIVTGGIGMSMVQDVAVPIEIITVEDLRRFGEPTVAEAAKVRWDETHRRLDSGKARREKQGG